jgi:hypothetical protein
MFCLTPLYFQTAFAFLFSSGQDQPNGLLGADTQPKAAATWRGLRAGQRER